MYNSTITSGNYYRIYRMPACKLGALEHTIHSVISVLKINRWSHKNQPHVYETVPKFLRLKKNKYREKKYSGN